MIKVKKQNRAFIITAVLSIAAIFCSVFYMSGNVTAASNSAIEDLENKLAQNDQKILSLEKDIKAKSADINKQVTEKNKIDEELGLVGDNIETADRLISEYINEIAVTEKRISDLELETDRKFTELRQLIKLTYEQGEMSYLEFLFDSKNFGEFLSGTETTSKILDYQKQVMEDLKNKLADLETEKEGFKLLKDKQNSVLQTLEARKSEYENLSVKNAAYISSLKNDRTTLENERVKAEEEKSKLNARIEEELEKLAKQNAVYIGGSMIWPLDTAYQRISSGYGKRWNEFHLGLDIPADYGSDIYATNGGKVIHAEYHYSYGNYVLIDHGGGIATLYAHASKLKVSVGDTIKQGDVIALVGSTGYSTGNHLHYEIRVNGVAVDPSTYK